MDKRYYTSNTKYYGIYIQQELDFDTKESLYWIYDNNGNTSNCFGNYPTDTDIELFKNNVCN